MNRLRALVLSFYREEPDINASLEPLTLCKMTRRWNSIRIECLDLDHFEKVNKLIKYLEEPLVALSLGKIIVLTVPGLIQKSFTLKQEFHSDLFS